MEKFKYFMPTNVLAGSNCVIENENIWAKLGKKAFIITGKNSAKKCGALDDVISVLSKLGIQHIIFNDIEENPSFETVEKAVEIGKKEMVDFVVGIGGGSPMDASKAIAYLLKNTETKLEDLLELGEGETIPLVEIPTTSGTGSEVTQYAILTNHKLKTKLALKRQLFPTYSFLDVKYHASMSEYVTINTLIDALSHVIESYCTINANFFSNLINAGALQVFATCKKDIENKNFTLEIREKLLYISTLAGITIAQTATSLPHGMGYALSYYKNVPHGIANGILLVEYLKHCKEEKVAEILKMLEFKDLDEFAKFLKSVLIFDAEITKEEINSYSDEMVANTAKLVSLGKPISKEEIVEIYEKSIEFMK